MNYFCVSNFARNVTCVQFFFTHTVCVYRVISDYDGKLNEGGARHTDVFSRHAWWGGGGVGGG